MPALTAMVVPPGTYRLRVAATDTTGRTGAVDTEVVAEMVKAGSLRLSSLVLGISKAGGFQPRLQFSNEPVALAYLDFFGGTAGAAIGAIVEVAQTLNGPPLAVNRLADRCHRRRHALHGHRRDPDGRTPARRLRRQGHHRHRGRNLRAGVSGV